VTPGSTRYGAADAGRARHHIPLIEANAEEVPLPDASFDLILSEYGASIWCDPYRCVELLRDYFDMHRFEWPDEADKSVEFHLGYGDWIRLLRANNFEVLDLIELRAPENAGRNRYKLATPEWGRRWPVEEIWKARKRG